MSANLEVISGEAWAPISGQEGIYSVSHLGRIKSHQRTHKFGERVHLLRERILKCSKSDTGYLTVRFQGAPKRVYVAHLVAAAFIGVRPNGHEVCHKDGCRANNAVTNLRYATHLDNELDKLAHGTTNRGERHGMSKLNPSAVFAIRSDVRPQKVIGRAYGVCQQTVCLVKNRKVWAHL